MALFLVFAKVFGGVLKKVGGGIGRLDWFAGHTLAKVGSRGPKRKVAFRNLFDRQLPCALISPCVRCLFTFCISCFNLRVSFPGSKTA